MKRLELSESLGALPKDRLEGQKKRRYIPYWKCGLHFKGINP